MATAPESLPLVVDEVVVHGVLTLLGLARVLVAVERREVWGTGPTLGLLLALWAARGLFRAWKS